MKNDLPLIPSDIAGSLAYTTGSIVSKILLKNDTLQITLFAVAKGESFSEHTTSKEALVHILEGNGEFFLKDKWHPFKTGDYFYMPASLLHAIKAHSDFKFLLYQF